MAIEEKGDQNLTRWDGEMKFRVLKESGEIIIKGKGNWLKKESAAGKHKFHGIN